MRRGWVLLCCLVMIGPAAALGAEQEEKPDAGPSLEYRPPKPMLPEPKGPTPAPPVAVFRESFGRFGIGRGSLDKPADVAFGAEERTYVLDAGNSRVQLFDRNNDFLLEWGGYGTDETRCQFKNPTAIFVIPDVKVRCSNPDFFTQQCEVVIVLDTGNHRFQWFKVPLRKDSLEKLPNLPCGHERSVFRSYKSPEDDRAIGDFGEWGEYGIGDAAKFNRPLDLVFERPAGSGLPLKFRVLDAGNERVLSFELGFDCDNKICFPDTSIFDETISNLKDERGSLKGLVSLAWSYEAPFDYLYLLGTGCSMQRLQYKSAAGGRGGVGSASLPILEAAWPAVAPESGLCVPARVRYEPRKEYLYVLDAGNGLLSVFHRGGNFIGALRGADRPFDAPRGFALRPESGEFAVADTGNDMVQKFTLR